MVQTLLRGAIRAHFDGCRGAGGPRLTPTGSAPDAPDEGNAQVGFDALLSVDGGAVAGNARHRATWLAAWTYARRYS